jgi:hypothetical protein
LESSCSFGLQGGNKLVSTPGQEMTVNTTEVPHTRDRVGGSSSFDVSIETRGVCDQHLASLEVGNFEYLDKLWGLDFFQGDLECLTGSADPCIILGFRESDLGDNVIGEVLETLVPTYREVLSPF